MKNSHFIMNLQFIYLTLKSLYMARTAFKFLEKIKTKLKIQKYKKKYI